MITWPLTTGTQSGMAVHRRSRRRRSSTSSGSTAITRTRRRPTTFVVPQQHDHQRSRRRVRISARRLQPGANGAWYAAIELEAVGAPDPRQPDDGLTTPQRTYVRYSGSLSRDFYSGSFQKVHFNGAYFGGRRSRSVQPVSVRPVRRHAHSRRAGVGRALRRTGDGARLVHVRYLRAVPVRPVPGAGLGPRSSGRPRLAGAHRASASRSTSARRSNTILRADIGHSLASRALSWHRFDRRADNVVEAARQDDDVGAIPTPVSRADLHVHSLALDGQWQPAVLPEPRLLLVAASTSTARRRRAAWTS